MSSNTPDSQQPQTTWSSRQKEGQFPSGPRHHAWRDDASLLEEMAAYPLGTLTPTGRIVRAGKAQTKCLEVTCSVCRGTFALFVSNIRLKKTTGCACQKGVKYNNDPRARVLGVRYSVMLSRINIPTCPAYPNYGGRGIQNKFTSREHYVRWVLENLPHPTYKGVQIDRINNDGHYEPGNLRLVTSAENLRNSRKNRWIEFFGERIVAVDVFPAIARAFPTFTHSEFTVRNRVAKWPLVDILRAGGVSDAEMAAFAASRGCTTSPMQDRDTDSL
jgi:hypothetical protein